VILIACLPRRQEFTDLFQVSPPFPFGSQSSAGVLYVFLEFLLASALASCCHRTTDPVQGCLGLSPISFALCGSCISCTGLSLPLYPRETRITGIDISREMLARAEKRVARDGLSNVDLRHMNAQQMDFPDNSFDKVVAMYVASVVPDPVALVNEMRRVCKPGGQLMFVNHFKSDRPVISRIEQLLVPLSAKLGFDPGFSLSRFEQECDLEFEHNRRVNLFGYWRMLQTTNAAGELQLVSNQEESVGAEAQAPLAEAS